MHQVNVTEMKEMVRNIAVTMDEPLMVWGPPGCGKSEGMAQVAEELDAVLVDIRLSQYDSVDLRGIPDVQNGMTTWNIPATLPFVGNNNFPDDKIILLFLDEINSAQPATAAVSYQLVNDGGVGEHKLKPNVRIVAAGNREGDKGVTNRMALPLANRFTHCEVVVDADVFSLRLVEMKLPQECAAFIQFRKPLVSTFDPSKLDKAFATPRTWVKAFRYYNAKHMTDKQRHTAMAGAIGDGPASEFLGFVDVWRSITPIKDVIADPTGVAMPDKGAMSYAMAVSVSGYMSTANVRPLHTYLKRMDPEFAIMAWNLALKRDPSLYDADEFIDYSKRYSTIW